MTQLSCSTVGILQWVGAGFALAAALFWLWASLAKLPAPEITWETINHIIPALRKQGRLNASAALCAAIAAVLQAFLIVQPTCINLT